MDIFSHGLWAGAAYEAINLKFKKKFSVKWAVFWGIFPDFFSFAILFVWLLGSMALGHAVNFPKPEGAEPMPHDTFWIFRLTSLFYSLSHSLIIFLIVFGLVYLIFKRPVWVLGGWLLHILIDIPTHSYQFYPTPFLWPVSGWKFNGFFWGTPWFLIANYLALVIVYLLLFLKRKKRV